jgi:hypothetical protein
MRSISAAMLAHLQGDVQTVATLWLITRTDGQQFAYTDFDQPIVYSGKTYLSAGGYTHSQIEMGSDLSTSNLEVSAIFDNSAITKASLESGQWDSASVVCQLVNYNDLTMGAVTLDSGVLGQISIMNGRYSAELRGLAQVVQQDQGQMYSPTCRATFGDARCTKDLAPLTFNGTVQSVASAIRFLDASLTQTGPTVQFADNTGRKIPTSAPYQIQAVPPTGGAFVANVRVRDNGNATWTAGSVSDKHYTVNGTGLYTFDATDAGQEVFIDYAYSIGYFAYGKVSFTSGQNAGFAMEVKTFAPGVVTLAMPLPYPIAVGDTYTIVAGCDKTFATCRDRWNNVLFFRGEPYIPGQDTILKPQGG